jgi:hypothetical protein
VYERFLFGFFFDPPLSIVHQIPCNKENWTLWVPNKPKTLNKGGGINPPPQEEEGDEEENFLIQGHC